MPDERHLLDAAPGGVPEHRDVQQLIEAESGQGTQGIHRVWQASDSSKPVLVSDTGGVRISRDNGTTPPAQVIVDGTPAGGHLSGTYPNPSLSLAIMEALVPTATIVAFAGAGAPAGWLLCNGQAVSRATYPRLFAFIGTAYGAGDGSTTFNVPNLNGRVVLGISGTHPLSQMSGAESVAAPTHTHVGSHSHGVGAHTHAPGTHSHGVGAHAHAPGSHSHGVGAHTHAAGTHSHDILGHRHDIGHEHLSPPTHPATTGASATTLNGRFTAGGANALPDAHTHPYDVPALGVTNSGVSSVANTGAPSADTGAMTGTPSTGAPSANDTGAVTGTPSTGAPSANDTGAVTGTPSTGPDTSAPAAVFDAPTIATMPPYVALTYLIRTGA